MFRMVRAKGTRLFSVLAVLLGYPSLVLAHVKWFVEQNPDHPIEVSNFSFHETEVQFWVVIILLGTTVALLLERFLPAPPVKLLDFARSNRRSILHLFQVMVGLSLLLTAARGAILAPHLEAHSLIGLSMRLIQGGIGVLFIANVIVPAAATIMVVLFAAHTALFGFISSLEYFNFLGIALFLVLESVSADHPAGRYKSLALPLLRIHTGIALGVLAWTEKLVDPALAMQFLEKNPINFMQTLGVESFSDRLFVLCAGCTELLFAIIFMFGLITRINTLTLAGFLVSSNLYFFLIGKFDEAFLELIGHLPLIAIAIIFIFYGGGQHLRLTNLFFRNARLEAEGEKRSGDAMPSLGNH